jgi:surface polysaccharide O-acyltransferase-like enzyme
MYKKFLMKYHLISKNILSNKIFKEKKNETQESLIIKSKRISNEKQKMLSYISFAKIMSSYGVIALHLNRFWSFNHIKPQKWIIENFYQSFFYYSVPIFVLCIGATLLDFNERYGLLEYNKKRFVKVFVPLIGWTFFLYLFKAYILKNISKIEINFTSIWNFFFASKMYSIFYSLHIFLMTYMLIPLAAFVNKSNKIKIYTYYFFLLLITQALIPYLITLFGKKIVWIYNLNVGYLIYIFAGYIIHNHIFSKLTKIIIYLFGISSFFIDLIGTQILAFKYKKIILIHKDYKNLPCILYSCAFFLFIKEYYYLIFKIINKKYINKLGSLTLGPFFMHLVVNEIASKFTKFNQLIRFNSLFYALVIFSICIIISYILKKIPLFKLLLFNNFFVN